MNEQYVMQELDLESRMGGLGVETERRVPRIDLTDREERREEITDQLWRAATEIGFFQLVGHSIPQHLVDAAFARAAEFFALPEETKAALPLDKPNNVGWEFSSQVRPSVGTPDQKESFQITRPHMTGLWPQEQQLPGFRDFMLDFEARCWELAMWVLSCFADRLGFDRDFFARAHDPESDQYQSTLRLIHYYALPEELRGAPGTWRAGAHTDFDCLTLLFQRDGQGGLQVCPGREADAQEWTPVVPSDTAITCNIGDMLMRWSDDQLLSTFHRVRVPGAGEYAGPRYSIPFFAQANRDVVIDPPAGTYPPITAAEYLRQRVAANYAGPRA
ncbi:isopenicillin N synthase family dioxygenase [Mycolicibacterium mucogenicum]|uniref:Isopenicillin N synthase family oxygenase n=1 Tax=Mycolicibacterium mucogenicum DSM 44124 TaxID=1226753 RepID=A0A8H2PHQ3_MYCMU|nr:2-oxoglutarate and iron-dependent oxygenase domain-containing protein [Mycolicibacterium mucogenicum]KAB7756912.1 2OG-Fe(II) oxygenase [Mycolicibacterium mucogenicum DSM 44124]QPG67416.1 isopenicillin N synthase family oxygenase [Mycolicibacterium mucogenicum DSM 44124]